MRDILATEGLQDKLFENTLARLAKVFDVDMKKQRLDSVHIQSNMRHLGRIGLFVKTIKKFLVNLKRQHRSLYDQLDNEMVRRYMSKKQASLFAMVKPSDSSRTLDQLANDVFTLTQRFAEISAVHDISSFKLLCRLMKEQCIVEQPDEAAEPVAVARPNKDVPSDSDAGYSSHKGQGYQVQVVENYSTNDDENKQLSLITHVTVESADQHDANAVLPALQDLEKRYMAPDELLVDSLYGSDSNCERAMDQHDVAVISPVMPGNQKKLQLNDFSFNNSGRIVSCPKGCAPEKVKKTKQGFSVVFAMTTCGQCEDLDRCPVDKGKKACYYRYSRKDIRIAVRRRYEDSPEFRDKYRYRTGVEATMSEFDRRTGVKHLRVCGMKAVRFAAIMKAIGLNILRAGRRIQENRDHHGPLCGVIWAVICVFGYVKEQIKAVLQMIFAITVAPLATCENRPRYQI